MGRPPRPLAAIVLVALVGGIGWAFVRRSSEPAPEAAPETLAASPAPPTGDFVPEQNLASAGRIREERRRRERERIEAAWAEILRLQQEGKAAEAWAAAKRLRESAPGWLDDKARAALVDRLRVTVEAAAKRADLEKMLAAIRVPAGQKDLAAARLAATAEVLARSGNDEDLDQLSRHLRRFLLPGAPATGGTSAPTDVLIGSFLQDRRARRGNDKNPPVADVSEAERRRVDQLDKLRQRNAVGLLDAIHAGLAWLALHQRDDGSFSDTATSERCKALGHDPACLDAQKLSSSGDSYALAATALAVLSFLDFRDQDPNGWFDPYLGRGIEWLRKAQKPDGSWPGSGQQYAGAMALMAMGQAAASTGSQDLREAVQRGLAFFERCQGPLGGFRYVPNDTAGDLSVTAWVAQATEAARGAGVPVPLKLSDGFDIFLRYVWQGESRFAYMYRTGPSGSLAPAGMLVGHIVGKDTDPAVAATWKKALATADPARPPGLYTLYYGVRVAILLNGALEDPWRAWAFALAKTQAASGSAAGSFPGAIHTNRQTGLATQTALSVLTLEHALYLR